MNVIITGASHGLGYEIAKHFLQEGANISICARNKKNLKKASILLKSFKQFTGQKIEGMNLDVSNETIVKDFIQHSIMRLGNIDILINNAGIYGPKGSIETVDSDEWKETIGINLFGVFNFMKHIIPHMKKNNYGKIINLSGGGATKPLPFISAYAASKVAIVRLTETIAEECKEFNIDINAIAPGLLGTRLFNEILEAGPEKVGKEFYNKITKQIKTPLSLGAKLCIYLASKQSDGITGKLISAVWDNWKDLHKHLNDLKNSDVYTLRRIIPKDQNKK